MAGRAGSSVQLGCKSGMQRVNPRDFPKPLTRTANCESKVVHDGLRLSKRARLPLKQIGPTIAH